MISYICIFLGQRFGILAWLLKTNVSEIVNYSSIDHHLKGYPDGQKYAL